MKKVVILALVLVLALSVTGCTHGTPLASESVSSAGDYPAAIMVDGAVYTKAYETAGEVDESAVIGHTTGYTDAYPTEDFHTNFSRETGLPVAKVSGGVAVLYDNEWQLFTVNGDVEILGPLGIAMTVKNVTPIGLTLTVTQEGGAPTGELSFGPEFALETLQDGVWETVPYLLDDEVAWNAIAYLLPLGESVEHNANWENLYGELPAGQYRIRKRIMDLRGPGDYDEQICYAEFTIEEAKYEKVSSLKKMDSADIHTLVKFDGAVYAQSYAVIDYAGGGEMLGQINMLTDSDLIPHWHGETNSEELRDAWVCERSGESLILCVDGEYRLFEKVK